MIRSLSRRTRSYNNDTYADLCSEEVELISKSLSSKFRNQVFRDYYKNRRELDIEDKRAWNEYCEIYWWFEISEEEYLWFQDYIEKLNWMTIRPKNLKPPIRKKKKNSP